MKDQKFITTDKHLELKEGIEIWPAPSNMQNNGLFKSTDGHWKAGNSTIAPWLEKGYIKEVQQPEFTRDDMIDFAGWYYRESVDTTDSDAIDTWIEDNK